MIDASNRSGYAGADVSAVISGAGVSRPTFYEYFEDRDTCLRASIEDVQDELLASLEHALHERAGHEAMAIAVEALVAYAAEHPARARFLMGSAMGGGTGALELRDRGIARVADAIERFQRRSKGGERLPDLDAGLLVGTVYRLLATRLRRSEAVVAAREELLGWLHAYERGAEQLRWRTLRPRRVPGPVPQVPTLPVQQLPALLPPGRTRLPEGEVAENHRLRILYAVARLAAEKGYAATRVADITRVARVDGRILYRHFSDKHDAFQAVHELGFQQVMDVTARAYFAAEGWPQRSWEAARALTALLQQNPLVAHVGFVEAYAVGPGAVQRIEDSHTAFVLFLQEGLVYAPQEHPPSRIAMEAIIASVFEVIYLQARRPERTEIAAMLPYIAHLWLTPFLGSEDADSFIDQQLKRPAPPRRRKG
ncbi:MAG TPA: TetR/AcrR family transcriptional regulator [Solirubrobacteraceae bacterium]|nr:TetR/AcrR family transcriptional regulator [Solirubrobacteraceae bacterium]